MAKNLIYIDEQGVQYDCKNEAECDRLWLNHYLRAAGLDYQVLVEAKNKIVTIQVHAGEYGDDRLGSWDDTPSLFVKTQPCFLSRRLRDVTFRQNDYYLEIEFDFEEFRIPVDESKTAEKVESVKAWWVGSTIWREEIWEPQGIDDDSQPKGITCQPMIQAFCTSAPDINIGTADNYRINISLVLPNGQAIGDLDPEDPE